MKFDQVIVDWPWVYSNRLTGKGRTKFGSGASGKYHIESVEAAHEMQISNLFADQCSVHLWVTGTHLLPNLSYPGEHIGQLIENLGLHYRCIEFAWVKLTKSRAQELQTSPLLAPWANLYQWLTEGCRRGPGHYTASNVELVVLAGTKKVAMPEVRLHPQIIFHPIERHSRKPPHVHHYIDRAYPDARKLELFARPPFYGENWTRLGFDVDGQDLRDSVPELAKA